MNLKKDTPVSGAPSAHWYTISKGRAIEALLGRRHIERLLDIGAGSGVFAEMLVADGLAERATCVDANYPREFVGERRTDKVDYVRSITAVDADAVLMVDVLEHVDNDVALLSEYVRSAPPGARFLIAASALKAFRPPCEEDRELRRRYSAGSLRRVVAAAGLKVRTTRYFFGLLAPAAPLMQLAEGRTDRAERGVSSAWTPGWLNNSLVALHDLERAALFPFNHLGGAAVFCLAEKPAALALDRAAA